MVRNSIAAALLALCLIASAPAQDAPTASIDAWLVSAVASGEIAAAVVAKIDGKAISVSGFGQRADGAAVPDAHTQFQIGSITKVYTHLLLAEMDAAGAAGYGQSIGEFMPKSFDPRNPAVAAITLEALATHSSGLPRLPANLRMDRPANPYADYGPRELRASLTEVRARQPLGDFYSYSNYGVGLLGYLLGSADGAGYRDAVSRRVIAPLHASDMAFVPGANAAVAVSAGKPIKAWTFTEALAGAGALWGSANDLGLLVQAYLGSGERAFKHDLTRDLEIVRRDAGNFAVTHVWHVADAAGQPIFWHNGETAGFHSFVGFRPDQQRGVAILLSGDADPTLPGLKALGMVKSAAPAAKVDRSIFGQYPLNAQFGIGVFELDGVLVAQASGQPALALHALGDDWYALGEADASIHLLREAGRVVSLELVQNGVVQQARRSAETASAAARNEIELDAATLAEYVGSYTFAPGAVLTVKLANGGLQAQLTGQPFLPIHARASDHFFYKVVDAELKFERNPAGQVEAVVLLQGGSRQRARKS